MPKLREEELARLKKIQDVDDDDLELDITKRTKPKKHAPHEHHVEQKEEPVEDEKFEKRSTRNLLITLGVIFAIFAIFVGVALLVPHKKDVQTIDELHQSALEGKLKPEEGYMYNGYSFVKFGDLWYTKIQNKNTTYDVTFNFDPKSVENITVEGQLNTDFVKDKHIYITFDPRGRNLGYIAVANYGISRSLAWAFGYNMTAACTQEYTKACETAGVVQCGDTERAVIYLAEANETKVILNSTCVTVQGTGPEIVRAKDRLLMRWYGIMK